ncbi:MAG: PAS domain S-box protein, partial [Planctomycetota bacterium]
ASCSCLPIDGAAGPVAADRNDDALYEEFFWRGTTVRRPVKQVGRVEAIVETAADAIITINAAGTVETFNRAASRLFGYQPEEVVGLNIKMLMPEPFRGAHDGYLQNYVRTGAKRIIGVGREVVAIRKDGSHVPVELAVSEFRHNDQRMFAGILRDVSERREFEERAGLLTAIFDSSVDAILAKDLDGTITAWNSGAERLYGFRAEDMVGRSIETIIPPTKHDEFKDILDSIARGERVSQLETTRVKADGTSIEISLNVSPIRNAHGEVIGASAIARDISDRVRAERRLQRYAEEVEHARDLVQQQADTLVEQAERLAESQEAAEAASRAKSEFLANMSHEIRTPMTAILGFADVLEERLEDEADQDAIGTIRRNGRYLLDIINDILDLSKIEAGKLLIESIECDVAATLDDVRGLMTHRAASKGHEFTVTADGPLPRVITSDPTRLRQILINLLGNAIKFTEAGRVSVVTRVDASDDGRELRFEVTDTGIGMSPQQLEKLFRPFTQADASTARKFGGTGLGLTISRRLTEMLGGELAVRSEAGVGTTFTLSIPLGADVTLTTEHALAPRVSPVDGTPAPTAVERAGLDGLRVLVAEDGPDNQRLIKFFLTKAGAEVEIAENGRIAVDRHGEALGSGTPFDVVLMDMQMPVLDGYSAVGELRRAGVTTPVIALTAHSMCGDAEKCLAAGCDGYQSKPVDRDALIGHIAELAPRTPATA